MRRLNSKHARIPDLYQPCGRLTLCLLASACLCCLTVAVLYTVCMGLCCLSACSPLQQLVAHTLSCNPLLSSPELQPNLRFSHMLGRVECQCPSIPSCSPPIQDMQLGKVLHLIDLRWLVDVVQLGWTALHDAAREGRSDIVQLLLDNGANPSVRDIVRSDTILVSWSWKHSVLGSVHFCKNSSLPLHPTMQSIS